MADNLSVVRSFFEHFGAGRWAEAFEQATDEFTFVDPNGSRLTQGELITALSSVRAMFARPFIRSIVGSTEEGDRVAVEMVGSAPLHNGLIYSNRYHYVFIVRDGKITEMREYCDTLATSVFRTPEIESCRK